MPTSAPVIWSIDLRVASAATGPPRAISALDVLDDDDRVVDQQADREHHAEHGQRVDREAERREHAERAEQHDRHGDRRDQRRAQVLQEQEHHEEHEPSLRTASRQLFQSIPTAMNIAAPAATAVARTSSAPARIPNLDIAPARRSGWRRQTTGRRIPTPRPVGTSPTTAARPRWFARTGTVPPAASSSPRNRRVTNQEPPIIAARMIM